MKKKVLFVINNLHCGGAEKALISLLETIDYSMYEVDLFLFKHEGIFLKKIPKQVNLLEELFEFKYYDMSIKKAVHNCISRGRLDLAFLRLSAGYIYKTEKNRVRCEQRVWKYISKSLINIDKKYDIAVGYLEKNPIYFCIDNVNATRKIGFIHNDYNKLGMDAEMDDAYFKKLDHLVTVSEECGNILMQKFPMYKHKIKVMYNIVSPAAITNLSLEQVDLGNGGIKLVSVGRLHYQKGFELAVQACKELVEHGYPVKWYVIGEGEERDKLQQLIDNNGLRGKFNLLGMKENPYPYIRAADIYVQTSRFEGKSIAIDEAKILRKPIVVTNFSTAKDQIKNNENGLIVEMNPKAIFEGIKSLIEAKELTQRFVYKLSNEKLGTESEIHKLYELFQ